VKGKALLAAVLGAAAALGPAPAAALCAVEGKLELVRLDLDQTLAFVLHIRQPKGVVANAFHVERTANGGLGDIPVVMQLLNLANPAHTTVLAVGDLGACPEAAEIERARAENKAVYSGRLLRVFVKYR
jgi:hypothetical protein